MVTALIEQILEKVNLLSREPRVFAWGLEFGEIFSTICSVQFFNLMADCEKI